MNAAIIPARGGSKRIPRKNIRPFGGRPMIVHSIQAALDSGLFERVVVSTDDAEIADIARKYGAEVPFIRSSGLSHDFATTHDVIAHAVRRLIDDGSQLTHACCIYATAPLIDVDDLRRGLDMVRSGTWDMVLAATTFAHPIFRAFSRLSEGGAKMIFPEHFKTRSQDLPELLHDAGQFYWAPVATWLAPPAGFTEKTGIVVLPRWRVQDIDTEEDWQRAEMILRMLKGAETA